MLEVIDLGSINSTLVSVITSIIGVIILAVTIAGIICCHYKKKNPDFKESDLYGDDLSEPSFHISTRWNPGYQTRTSMYESSTLDYKKSD